MVHIWNTRTRERIRGPLRHDARVRSIAFSPDDAYIVTGYQDGTVRFWDVATGKSIVLPRRHIRPAYDVAYRPDGSQVVSGSLDGTVRFWHAPPRPIDGDVKRIVLWTQVITGQELDQAGTVRFLDRDTWRKRRLQLQALGGPPLP